MECQDQERSIREQLHDFLCTTGEKTGLLRNSEVSSVVKAQLKPEPHLKFLGLDFYKSFRHLAAYGPDYYRYYSFCKLFTNFWIDL
jgi:hypothetical protein